MSIKGDLPVNNASSSFSKLNSVEPLILKTLPPSPKITVTTSPITLSSKSQVLTTKSPINSEGIQNRTTSPTVPPPNFASRFITKSPLRALTIDTNNEPQNFNLSSTNRPGSFSAIHNTTPQQIQKRNSLASGQDTNQPAKIPQTADSQRQVEQVSPSRNGANTMSLVTSKPLLASGFPHSTTNKKSSQMPWVFGNDLAQSLLTSITPTGLHSRKVNMKSHSQERHRVGMYGSFDTRIPQPSQFRKKSIMESSRPLHTSGDIMDNIKQDKNEDSNLHIIFNSLKKNFSTSSQTPTGKKFMMPIPNHEPTKCSVTRNGIVKAYAANTNQGIVRNYNEDRVSIILNIMKPASRVNEEWPKCSFFGVYDGHGGVGCADFLRDHLHQYVIKEPSFPLNPKEALIKGFEAAEKTFLALAEGSQNREFDRSGSCCLVVLIVGDMCYVANVGDSRAVMSGDGGSKIYPLSKDHKPNEENEQKRITEAGGKIYQSQGPVFRQTTNESTTKGQMQLLLGPHRVLPGRLSVSRTFGDIEAKMPKFGGNPNVVVATPDIKAFRISPEHDFIILATDGVYDKLSSRDVVKSVWESTEEKAANVHHQCGLAVENILREAINRRTLDNITVVMICFENFKQRLFPEEASKKTESPELITQPDTEPNKSLVQTMSSSFPTESRVNTDGPIQKEKVQDKPTSNERTNAKGTPIYQKSFLVSLTETGTPTYLNKRHSSFVRGNSPESSPFYKKENKEKESVPISDVNLLSKSLLAKKLNGEQKTLNAVNKLLPQVHESPKAPHDRLGESKNIDPPKISST